MLSAPLRADGGPVDEQVESVKEEAAGQVGLDKAGTPSGAQRFHVPLRFDTSAAMQVAAEERAKAEAALAATSTDVQRMKDNITKFEAEIARPDSLGGSAFDIRFANRLKLKLQNDLAFAKGLLPAAEEQLSQAQQNFQRTQNSVKVLEQLAAIPKDSGPYVVAIVCDRMPKSPNPDTAFFA
jgi:hypothetical protein